MGKGMGEGEGSGEVVAVWAVGAVGRRPGSLPRFPPPASPPSSLIRFELFEGREVGFRRW